MSPQNKESIEAFILLHFKAMGLHWAKATGALYTIDTEEIVGRLNSYKLDAKTKQIIISATSYTALEYSEVNIRVDA